MKLKIVHQNQESRGGGEEQAMKTEDAEEPAKDSFSPPEPSPGKRKRKPKELIDEVSSIIVRRRRKSFSSSKSQDDVPDSGGRSRSKGDAKGGGPGSTAQIKSPTMIRAEEFMLSLSNDQPSFLKSLVRSHVASCFWMGLPGPFCKIHLPGNDTEVILEDENGEKFPIKYIANKTGLSAGWRKFVAGNKLVEGDVLIFQLIGPCKFKVYTIRANDLTEVDGALSLLILDSQTKQNDAEGTVDAQSTKKRRRKSLPMTVVQKKKQKAGLLEEQSGNDSDEVASEVLEGAKLSGSFHFKDVNKFDEFHIVVNGVCIDSDLPEDIRRKYYELCCSKNSFLHDRLLPGLYSKLAAGMIVETINIADSIRGCKPTTPRKDFEVWEKSLRSFELLGLNVGFIRSRLHQLQRLAFETEDALEIRRYLEVQKEQSRANDEIQKLEAKLVELREISAKCDHELENLRIKKESYELKFQVEVDAPW
ncbi:B3 domain-containing protein Os01g0234100-like isoform X2 [Salvia miltiorrhiza]|uniref:B3 domain-containing protein Os01g0234100-like isoform X2 n=1 Tax=Salvia miltiorrhiza TaxID=226208 RepID=UPI0025ACDE6D|nr:B3 domain-containing protein Os01g0234100-like isoform X2 [Salvia miltiorrhiza]